MLCFLFALIEKLRKKEGKFMAQTTNIVILGAGYAGIHAAKKLAKTYKKMSEVTITLSEN
jgi:ribulose 1,5-bisphosphate synthetase/thiazole synthase